MLKLTILFFISFVSAENVNNTEGEKVASLTTRPLPAWYDEAKIGIFVHWGVYAVPALYSEWFAYFWEIGDTFVVEYMKTYYPPNFTYNDFAPMFTAELFNPDEWADLFEKAGAKYVVLTTKHHDGYTLFPSKQSKNWNTIDVGPRRDLVGEVANAIRKKGLEFGAYYSLMEWNNRILIEDEKTNKTHNYVEQKLLPDLYQIVNEYKPSIVWADGEFTHDAEFWNSSKFLTWLYHESPVSDKVVVNDRWGGPRCVHGDFRNCDDRYNPRMLLKRKWENAFPLDSDSWGYRKDMNAKDVMSDLSIIENIVSTVSCGGNALINVGPTKEGIIPLIFQERLLNLGSWLKINGEAIYGTSPWLYQSENEIWYTCRKKTYNALNPTAKPTDNDTVLEIYGILVKWPKENVVSLNKISSVMAVTRYNIEMLGHKGFLNFTMVKVFDSLIVNVKLPNRFVLESQNAWTLKFTKMSNALFKAQHK